MTDNTGEGLYKKSYDIVIKECEELRRRYWEYHSKIFRKYELGYSVKCHSCNILFSEKPTKAFLKTQCPICLDEKQPILITVCGHPVCKSCFEKVKRIK